jgi:hypothetical protein
MKWQIPFILSLLILLSSCKKDDPEPDPIEPAGPKAGELVFTDLIALKEAGSDQVKAKAPGGLLLDTVIYDDPRLVYGLLPDNFGMDVNLTMSYIFHHDSLMRIVFRDTTATSNFELAQQLSELAQGTVYMDSIRHFIALKGEFADEVSEFPSVDSLWNYIQTNNLSEEEIVVLSSIWQDADQIFSISFAGNHVNLATGHIRFLDSNGITRGANSFRTNTYPEIWD